MPPARRRWWQSDRASFSSSTSAISRVCSSAMSISPKRSARLPAGGSRSSSEPTRRTVVPSQKADGWAGCGLHAGRISACVGLAEDMNMRAGLRRVVYDIVEPGSKPYGLAIAFDRLSIVVILASIACAVLATEPSIGPDWQRNLMDAEYGFGALFLIEYALRLWTAPEHPLLAKLGRWQSRLELAAQPLLILHFLGVLPFVLTLAAPERHETILTLQVVR